MQSCTYLAVALRRELLAGRLLKDLVGERLAVQWAGSTWHRESGSTYVCTVEDLVGERLAKRGWGMLAVHDQIRGFA